MIAEWTSRFFTLPVVLIKWIQSSRKKKKISNAEIF